MIAEQFATERQVNIIETERRFIVSILAIGLAASWLVSQASGQMVPTANVNDSARGILQRYADNIATGLSQFIVEGEKRYWLHIAIDRFDGTVVGQQLEEVLE
jgi:hypothetical protein